MRTLNWLLRGLLFFVLFAFALNNQQLVDLHWFMGYKWQAPMVFIVLAVFALGCVFGALAMVPSWWRHRRDARNRARLMPGPVKASPVPAKGKPQPEADTAIPSHLPFPPDMPAPRKPGK
ncbi:lipopolysaccharide assembly LapA domain-containing protein [Aquabacterium sp.]|jgi:putative membrane protein|uniref:LapA family protein n=1 Tax=Aquabacterium sp. TaxID=1872578 RepID=UPI0025B99DDC|nr:LapA family protein [Aquabacterium sp.]